MDKKVFKYFNRCEHPQVIQNKYTGDYVKSFSIWASEQAIRCNSSLRCGISASILDARNKVAINLRSAQGENTFSFNLYEIAKIGSFA